MLGLDLFTEFTDHLAMRKILLGVKGRVEGHPELPALANREFAVFVASALIFLAAALLILLRPLTWTGWLAGFAAGAGWLISWYAPVPYWAGALLEGLVLIGLYRAFR